MVFRPVAESRSISAIFTSAGSRVFSFCRPSRAPTSTIRTWLWDGMADSADRIEPSFQRKLESSDLARAQALDPGFCRDDGRRDRKSGGSGKSVSVRVYLGGRRVIKKKNIQIR